MAAMKRLQDIATAVADELQLDSDDEVYVSQVTITVTYSVNRQTDFIDEWYASYIASLANDIEIPF